jgi:hypothetical protein
VLKNVRIYRLVNAARTSPYKALVVDRDLTSPHAWARLVELNNVAADQHVFWALSEEVGTYDTPFNDQLEVCQSDLKQEETQNLRYQETLRNVTMEAVLTLLHSWGIHSTVEFPGYLNVEFKEKNLYWAVGPIQDGNPDPTDYVWTGELHTVEGHMVASLKVEAASLWELTRKLYLEMMMKVEQEVR